MQTGASVSFVEIQRNTWAIFISNTGVAFDMEMMQIMVNPSINEISMAIVLTV